MPAYSSSISLPAAGIRQCTQLGYNANRQACILQLNQLKSACLQQALGARQSGWVAQRTAAAAAVICGVGLELLDASCSSSIRLPQSRATDNANSRAMQRRGTSTGMPRNPRHTKQTCMLCSLPCHLSTVPNTGCRALHAGDIWHAMQPERGAPGICILCIPREGSPLILHRNAATHWCWGCRVRRPLPSPARCGCQ